MRRPCSHSRLALVVEVRIGTGYSVSEASATTRPASGIDWNDVLATDLTTREQQEPRLLIGTGRGVDPRRETTTLAERGITWLHRVEQPPDLIWVQSLVLTSGSGEVPGVDMTSPMPN